MFRIIALLGYMSLVIQHYVAERSVRRGLLSASAY